VSRQTVVRYLVGLTNYDKYSSNKDGGRYLVGPKTDRRTQKRTFGCQTFIHPRFFKGYLAGLKNDEKYDCNKDGARTRQDSQIIAGI
jgi:hypothetical protein